MRIEFTCDGVACEFRRSWFVGTATLRVGEDLVALQAAADPTTHFSLTLTREWEVPSGEHTIRIQKHRPPLLAGVLPHDYLVTVDGEPIAQRRGY